MSGRRVDCSLSAHLCFRQESCWLDVGQGHGHALVDQRHGRSHPGLVASALLHAPRMTLVCVVFSNKVLKCSHEIVFPRARLCSRSRPSVIPFIATSFRTESTRNPLWTAVFVEHCCRLGLAPLHPPSQRANYC